LTASINCDGDGSSDMWRTLSKIKMNFHHTFGRTILGRHQVSHSFASWKGNSNKCDLPSGYTRFVDDYYDYRPIEAVVAIETESESFNRQPIIDAKSSIHDVILVLEGQKFPVNKKMLSAQSSYFNSLFYGDFKESKQEEIEIKETDPEDFHELLKMMHGESTEPTTVENAIRYLMMADKFDLIHIVKDRIENFLLSTDLISIHRKFLIAEENKLEILKSEVLRLCKKMENLWALKESS
ncbi:hypothetical protein PENTCL1PPCAC_13144, partial [Pristionchus entomophagus]